MTAYYNEHDAKAAAWLRELIRQGRIAPGVVDERSIEDIEPRELAGFTQCHFFAGIGVWSHALRRAGWPDDRPVWTGSCPCQPFSAAGKGEGFADERHLWPAWHHLISQCRPAVVFGEQVASKDGLGWLDLVQSDMEAAGYAFGAADLCAAGVGAPHIRQRLYFVANANDTRPQGRPVLPECTGQRAPGPDGMAGLMANATGGGCGEQRGEIVARDVRHADSGGDASGGLAYTDGWDAGAERQQRSGEQRQQPQDGGAGELADATSSRGGPGLRDSQSTGQRRVVATDNGGFVRPGPVNGFWRDADWIGCTDGKWRPVESGTFPLAHGAPARVGRLRGYGNAIVAPLAQAFVEEVMGCL